MSKIIRPDGRKYNELRQVKVTRDYIKFAEGSNLFELGETKVICTASVEENVPSFMRGKGRGWITAEYNMIPRSSQIRIPREGLSVKPKGRTQEIQRLIGRSLRTVVDLENLGERTIWLDCDVIQADGGTRVASITGSFIALYDAVRYIKKKAGIEESLIKDFVAAVSVGKVGGENFLDLCYREDVEAGLDMNIVMTKSGKFIEIQGTAEKNPFSKKELDELITLAQKGIKQLIEIQKEALNVKGLI